MNPANLISNPILLDVYKQLDSVMAQHGPQLVQSLGQIYTFEITMASGKVLIFTIDAKHDQGKLFIGAPNEKPDMTMKLSEDTFVKLLTNQLSAQSALLWGQLKIVGSTSQAL